MLFAVNVSHLRFESLDIKCLWVVGCELLCCTQMEPAQISAVFLCYIQQSRLSVNSCARPDDFSLLLIIVTVVRENNATGIQVRRDTLLQPTGCKCQSQSVILAREKG